MIRAAVVFTYRPDGSGTLWVHRPRGTWRRIAIESVEDIGRWAGALGSATTQPRPGVLLVAQVAPGPVLDSPRIPRAGPAVSPMAPNAP